MINTVIHRSHTPGLDLWGIYWGFSTLLTGISLIDGRSNSETGVKRCPSLGL